MVDLTFEPRVANHSVVALNAGKLWWESLQRLFVGTHFVLYPRTDAPLSELLIGLDPPAILLYRDTSATGHCVEWIGMMRANGSTAKLVVLAPRLRLSVLVRAMQAGADGFLTEDISGHALVQSLELVMAGERVLPGALG